MLLMSPTWCTNMQIMVADGEKVCKHWVDSWACECEWQTYVTYIAKICATHRMPFPCCTLPAASIFTTSQWGLHGSVHLSSHIANMHSTSVSTTMLPCSNAHGVPHTTRHVWWTMQKSLCVEAQMWFELIVFVYIALCYCSLNVINLTIIGSGIGIRA